MVQLRVLSILALLLSFTFSSQAWSASEEESEFLFKIHDCNRAEIQVGLLAQVRGQSDEVREYGRMLVGYHTQTELHVIELAAEQGLSLIPGVISAELLQLRLRHDLIFAKLLFAPEEDFDQAFVALMEQDHRDAINMVNTSLPSLRDEDLNYFARSLLPVLEQHRFTARRLMN